MRDDQFRYIAQDMQWYSGSVREADNENDLYREAEQEALEENGIDVAELDRYIEGSDMFKAGWEAAVRLLDDNCTKYKEKSHEPR